MSEQKRPFLDLGRLASLEGLDDLEFKLVVDADLRRNTKSDIQPLPRHLSDELRSPKYVERWFSMLTRMAKNTDSQLAVRSDQYEAARAELRKQLLSLQQSAREARRDNSDTATAFEKRVAEVEGQLEELRAAYLRVRGGTLRFKGGLDTTMLEARFLRDQARGTTYESVVADERNHYATRVTALETAIRTHRQSIEDEGIKPNEYDEILWATVN